MDLNIDLNDYRLNVRAAAVIIHENKLLSHINTELKHYSLPGGRVQIGEDSETTVKREIKEELGKEITIERYFSTVENFFEKNGHKFHEILFIYKAEFKNEDDKKITHTLYNAEGKEYLKYKWLDLDEIEKYNYVAKCLPGLIKNDNHCSHLVYREQQS